jgi:molybdopterin molybdotransferase
MIPFAEARAIVLSHASPLGTEEVSLAQLLGRYLAEPVAASFDLPLFDNSAMDGYGVKAADVAGASEVQPACLTLHGLVRAGDAVTPELPAGAAVKLLTGAMIPPGVEAVVMSEVTEEREGTVLVKTPVKSGENIRRRGEEYRKGDTALPAGARVTPPVIGLLATFGYASARVHAVPRVAVLVTGSELVSPGESRAEFQIYDSNSAALDGALAALGIAERTVVRVRDEVGPLRAAMQQALASADVIIAAGGVSVGEYDLVKEVCAELGVETLFWQVRMKPAKPLYFGSRESGIGNRHRPQLIFGLPGNPVAVLVAFHQFVKPALQKMMGAGEVAPRLIPAVACAKLRKKRGRMEFVRGLAWAEGGRLCVKATTGQGSHMLGGLAAANCLIRLSPETETVAEGEPVEIEFLSWEQ